MISYSPFYKTLKEKNISTYRLIKDYGVIRSLLDRLKHNKPVSTVTLNGANHNPGIKPSFFIS